MSGAEIFLIIQIVMAVGRVGGRLLDRWREWNAVPTEWQITLLLALVVIMGVAWVQRNWLRISLTWFAVCVATLAAVQCGALDRFGVGLYRWMH